MKNFRIFIGIMVLTLVVSLCISTVASAQGQRQGPTTGGRGILSFQAPTIIHAYRPFDVRQATFTPTSVIPLDFDEIPGTQIRMVIRGGIRPGSANATEAFFRLTTNKEIVPDRVEIEGSTVSTTTSVGAEFMDTGWILFTKPAGLGAIVIESRIDAAIDNTDRAVSPGATIWFK